MKRTQGKDTGRFAIDKWIGYILPFCFTVIILLFLFWKEGYCPFGNNSLARNDAEIQYLDFFAYLKDLLAGKNSLFYSFSKALGGTNIAVFSYYLTSPFNILALFFKKSNLVLFFDCIAVLKLAAAATTMAWFLKHRFSNRLNDCFVLMLSVSYALMQYEISQARNIMWLDGVYMLPFMLLGIYKLVNGKKPYMLLVSTALSIIFNWYTAGINCLFTVIWFCLEWLLALPNQIDSVKGIFFDTIKKIGVYIISMLMGILLSAFLFVPSLITLSSNGRGQIDWSILTNTFNANIMNIVQGFTLGATSENGRVSLYCGSLALLGCIGFFVSKKIDIFKKIKIGFILAISLLTFYWQPLFVLFSLLKLVESHFYRHAYVVIFLLIFIAAEFYSEMQLAGLREHISFFLKISIAYSFVLFTLSYSNPIWGLKEVYLSCIFMIAVAALVALCYTLWTNAKWRHAASCLLVCVLTVELACNTDLLMNVYHSSNASKYETYSLNQQEQIAKVKEFDTGVYRISQTRTYNSSDTTLLTANYDEAYAYNYWSISSYTSDPDEMQCTFLERLGYGKSGTNMNIVNTSVLAADALLGVKYVLSDSAVKGLKLLDSFGENNGKNVYYNPYALPMAFVYGSVADSGEIIDTNTDTNTDDTVNPFEYQNQLYSQLMGKEVELYVPLNYEKNDDKNSENTLTYTIDLLEGNYAVYGNIPWGKNMKATMKVNDSYEMSYSCWLSPSVFYIPTEYGDTTAAVTLTYEQNTIVQEQFYVLDLNLLDEITTKLKQQEADTISIQNGNAKFQVSGEEGENLYLSIPYNKGWTIIRNGQEVEPELFADCMISIPLESGLNTIVMNYHVPYFKLCAGISLAAWIGLGAEAWIKRRRRRR